MYTAIISGITWPRTLQRLLQPPTGLDTEPGFLLLQQLIQYYAHANKKGVLSLLSMLQ